MGGQIRSGELSFFLPLLPVTKQIKYDKPLNDRWTI